MTICVFKGQDTYTIHIHSCRQNTPKKKKTKQTNFWKSMAMKHYCSVEQFENMTRKWDGERVREGRGCCCHKRPPPWEAPYLSLPWWGWLCLFQEVAQVPGPRRHYLLMKVKISILGWTVSPQILKWKPWLPKQLLLETEPSRKQSRSNLT